MLSTNYKDLVLAGGGHSHALVIKMWGMKPLPGVRVTLISPQILTPYSGMLPGLVAGHYTLEQTHIDLSRLCQFAGIRFLQSEVTQIDPANQIIELKDRASIGYDVLSINNGITPDLTIPGAAEHTIPVKPIAEFYPKWQQLCTKLQQPHDEPQDIVVVGGGAAGVELILAIQHAVRDIRTSHSPHFHLIQMGEGLPEGYPRALQNRMANIFTERGIQLHDNVIVSEVTEHSIISQDGQSIPCTAAFWCTNAAAAPFLAQSGLNTDQLGFIAVNSALQSTSHNNIFAAGDIASLPNPRPKAGVFAVRQGPVLLKNLKRFLLQQPLTTYQPQDKFLSLLACGDRYALGCRKGANKPTFSGRWVWHWKDHIDQKFMRMFSELVPMSSTLPCQKKPQKIDPVISGTLPPQPVMRCGGCGAKVGATILSRVLSTLNPISQPNVLLGIQSADDASAINIQAPTTLIQSVDSFRAIIDDPYLLGKIAALHALSDIFAMNANAHSALAIATLPHAGEALVERDLKQMMQGAIEVLNEHQCALIGGHSSEGEELSLGFSINAFTEPDLLLKKSTPKDNEQLILCKPLGTGTLFAAHAQLKAQGVWIEAATTQMLQSNLTASQILHQHQASACTDITGFGLIGHLVEMLKPSQMQAQLSLDAIPALPGAIDCLAQGINSTLQPQNNHAESAIQTPEAWRTTSQYPLLFDPQTSGGLLASIPREQANACLTELHAAGYEHACIIGQTLSPAIESTSPLIQLKS